MSHNSIKQGLLSAVTMFAFAQAPEIPITFTTPKSWTLLNYKSQNEALISVFKICENQISPILQIPSNALITRYKLPEAVSFADVDRIVESHVRGATLIVTGQDQGPWKTYIYVIYENKQQLVILYRIGIINGYGIEAMVCFPHIASKDTKTFKVLTLTESTIPSGKMAGIYCNPATFYEMVHQFNELCSSLKIQGENSFEARAQLIDPPADSQFFRKVDEPGR